MFKERNVQATSLKKKRRAAGLGAGRGALGKARSGGARPAPGTRPLTPAAAPRPPAGVHFSGSSGRPRGRDARWALPPRDPGWGRVARGVGGVRRGVWATRQEPAPAPGVRAPAAPRPPRSPPPRPDPRAQRGRWEGQPTALPGAGVHLEERTRSPPEAPGTRPAPRPGKVAFFSVLPAGPLPAFPRDPDLEPLGPQRTSRGGWGGLDTSGKNPPRTEVILSLGTQAPGGDKEPVRCCTGVGGPVLDPPCPSPPRLASEALGLGVTVLLDWRLTATQLGS
ncbi:basic proline-rich protein-like [Leopardus geoffroyi]|uniref:basic proline-rich protein-like n=1 Tax=Leopardus geoffroyi TaxID=46844 RepID=UPI001E25EA1A|nr:basic proline-rich protein-like [Leopardus geoffroyi]